MQPVVCFFNYYLELLPIIFFQIPEITEGVTNTSVCVYWDFELRDGVGDWSSNGCNFKGMENDRVVCECTHLTNFAVIMVRLSNLD